MTSITLPRSKSSTGIAYHQMGEGEQTVVLIHGVGLRLESWLQQFDAVSEQATVYAIDMPGHGESDCLADEQPDLPHYVAQIKQFIETIIAKPVVIMGHSMGAMIALALADALGAQCRGVVALNAVYRRSDEAKQAVKARAEAMNRDISNVSPCAPIARWFSEAPSEHEAEMATWCRQWLEQANPRGYAQAYSVFAREDGPSDALLSSLQMPALFLTGDGDKNSSGVMSRQMAAQVKHGQAMVVEDARHLVQLTHAAVVNQALLSFLAECE